MQEKIAEVAVPRPVDRTFDYAIPPELADVPAGVRVRVQFGRERVVGYLLRRKAESDYEGRLQPLQDCLDDDPVLTPAVLSLARWMSARYLCPLGLVLQAILPQRLSRARPSRSKLVGLNRPLQDTLAQIERLQPTAPQQANLLRTLLNLSSPSVRELLSWAGSSDGPLRALVEKGHVKLQPKPPSGVTSPFRERAAAVALTGAQRAALGALTGALDGDRGAFLLHGVNGSGKTEVYLHALQHVLSQGKTAIMAVPEIALTPQLLARVRGRLGDGLAVLHSGLTDAQRAREWTRLRDGEARVAVGVRSASLVPLDGLGLIVLDEEHESTYRQESPEPRYHARDVALRRAAAEGAVAVLGSATPSLEAFHAAQSGALQRLALPERVVPAPLPEVELVDMSQSRRRLSPELEAALGACLGRGEQAMLLVNRRGFGIALCGQCRAAQRCPSCGIALTFHLRPIQLRCHYCGYEHKGHACRACGGELEFLGTGTQRMETILKRKFPTARVARMDSDAVKRGQHGALLEDFRSGRIDVLLGTQMIGLGHDFPGVTLMGIADADALLDVPDFRGAERTFQLISQASGRAGRGERDARVLLQTRHPEHYVIRHALGRDYEAFAREELGYREALGYPPYAHLIRLTVAKPAEAAAREAADRLKAALAELNEAEVLGPARALPYRWRGRHRWQLLLKADAVPPLRDELIGRVKALKLDSSVEIDVDP